MTNSPAAAPEPDPSSPQPGALLNDEQIRWVRRAIAVMTAVLIAGIALLIGRVIYLARPGGTQAASSAGPAAPSPAVLPPALLPPELLPQVRLALPAGAEIRAMSLSGSRLAVEHAMPGGSPAISILDLATGQVVSRVGIDRAP